MKADVVIVGGGLAGLALAQTLALRRPSTSVVVIAGPPARDHKKLGESLVELSSHYLAHDLDLRAHLDAAHVPKLGLRFLNRGPRPTPLAERLEYGVFDPPGDGDHFVGAPVPAWQVDRGVLEAELRRRVEAGGARVLDAPAREISLGERAHRVSTDEHTVHARWLVDASGGRRLLGRSLGEGPESLDHRAHTLHGWADAAIDPEALAASAAFTARMRAPGLRRHSTTHYTGPGYWIWSILLPSGQTSFGIMIDPARESLPLPPNRETMLAWLGRREPELAAALASVPLGGLRYRKGNAYRAPRVYARERWAITGDAAVHLDPLYSSGIDFIAITNQTIASLVELDLSPPPGARSLAAGVALSELLHRRLVDGYVTQYRAAYAMLGEPAQLAQKAIWDSAFYFGVHALLFAGGALTDPRRVAALRADLDDVYRLHHRAQRALRASAAPIPSDAYLAHDQTPILRDTYARLHHVSSAARGGISDETLTSALRDNVRQLRSHLRAVQRGEALREATR